DLQSGTLSLAGGNHTLAQGSSVVGSGKLLLSGAYVSLEGAVTVSGHLELAAGVLAGAAEPFPATLAGAGDLSWTGGEMRGTVTVAPNTTLSLSGDGAKVLRGVQLTNQGTLAWAGAGPIQGGDDATISNQSLFLAANDSQITHNFGNRPTFLNKGTFRKAGSSGETAFPNSSFWLNQSGVMDVQSGTVDLAGGTHTLSDGSSYTGAGRLLLGGAQVTLAGTATVSGHLELAAGFLFGATDPKVAAFAGAGDLSWTGGELRGVLTVVPDTNFALRGDGVKTLRGGRITNNGTLTWLDSGPIFGGDDGAITNNATLILGGDAQAVHAFGNRPSLVNLGLVSKTGGTGSTDFPNSSFQLIQSGTLEVKSGAVTLSGGYHQFTAGAQFTGTGTTRLQGATVNAQGLQTVTGPVELSGGILTGNASYAGKGFLWTGGELQGTHQVSEGALWTLAGPELKRFRGAHLQNAGTLLWTGTGILQGGDDARILNTGLLEVRNDSSLTHAFGNRPTLENRGTFRKTQSAGATTFPGSSFALAQSGVVDVQTGTIDLSGGLHLLLEGSKVMGAGALRCAGAQVDFEGQQNIEGTVRELGGRLVGTATFQGKGLFEWTGGEMSASYTFADGLSFAIDGRDTKTWRGGGYALLGATTWNGEGGILAGDDAAVTNSGTFDAQTPLTLTHAFGNRPSFNNRGTLRTTKAGAVTFPGSSLRLNNTGILQGGPGAIDLAGGDHSLADKTVVSGSSGVRVLGGTVTTGKSITAQGPFELAGGILTAGGDVLGTLTWTGGELRGHLSIPSGSNLVIAGDSDKTLRGGLVENRGTVLGSGKGVVNAGDGAVVANSGQMTLAGGGFRHAFGGGPELRNSGTLSLSPGPDGISLMPTVNSGLATVSGSAQGVTVGGTFTQEPGASMEMLLTSADPSVPPRISVSGTASLDGTLKITQQPGFTMAPEQSLSVFHAGDLAGSFATLSGLGVGGTGYLMTDYTDHDLLLQRVDNPQGTSGLWMEMVGRDKLRLGRPGTDTILYGNSGPVDVYDLVLVVRAPLGMDVVLEGPVMPTMLPPADSPLRAPGYITDAISRYIPIYIYRLPAGGAQAIRVRLTPQTQGPHEMVVVEARLFRAPDSEFSRTGLGQSYFIDQVSKMMGRAYVEAALDRLPQSPVPPPLVLQDPVRTASEMVAENDWDLQAAAGRYLKQVPSDLEQYNTGGFFNQQLQNPPGGPNNIQGIFDVGPVSAPVAQGIGFFLDTACAAAWTVCLLGGPVTLTAAIGLSAITLAWNAYSFYSTGQSLENIRKAKQHEVITPGDPNEKVGPPGVGEARYIKDLEPLPYTVYFENVPTASASAQEVIITDQLPADKLDLGSFRLGPISFGSRTVVPPYGSSSYTTAIDLRPARNLIVRIEAGIDLEKAVATWHYTALDPATMKLTEDPELGFLDANKTPPEGEGNVTFTVAPRPGLRTGTEIKNQASIVFDKNAAIATNTWSNSVDTSLPSSRAQSLPETAADATFDVSWSGTDEGSGIRDYSIYVSENGAAPVVWQHHTGATTAKFTGKAGKSYAFYSLATDNAGNTEGLHATPDATTRVPGVGVKLGDANLDGKLSVQDVILGLKALLGLVQLNADQTQAADVNKDGKVNIADVVKILRAVAGLDTLG
ncbi:MAG TPA: dockerin type I domain-containing protein, partial [Armatimonadota bacterium]